MVEISNGILDELKGHKETMAEQCKLLKMIAANQVKLAKLLKRPVATGGKGPGAAAPVPSGGAPPAPSVTAPSASTEGGTPGSPGLPQSWYRSIHLLRMKVPIYTPFVPPQAPSNVVGRFWCYQPSVAA